MQKKFKKYRVKPKTFAILVQDIILSCEVIGTLVNKKKLFVPIEGGICDKRNENM
jgi:hypothetical protein